MSTLYHVITYTSPVEYFAETPETHETLEKKNPLCFQNPETPEPSETLKMRVIIDIDRYILENDAYENTEDCTLLLSMMYVNTYLISYSRCYFSLDPEPSEPFETSSEISLVFQPFRALTTY